MLTNYIDQLLNLDNYYDGLLVADKNGCVEFFLRYRPDISSLDPEEIVGKHVLEIYPDLTEESSTIMRVLKTGEPIYNEYQTLVNFHGEIIHAINTTLPIREGGTGEIVGVVDVSRYVNRFYEKQSINIHAQQTKKDSFYHVDDIISCSKEINEIKRKIPLYAKTNSTVLITGESGTGKELVAQSIHTSSDRNDRMFVSQNCAAIPATLLESILFGTTKGSYTGAENKPGLFEIANGGTLFLDELNSMDITVQPKLLRAIEEKKVSRLGSYKPISVDVKIVAAMNADPLRCVADNRLREDLLYRLSVVRVDMPPLRNRLCDVELLTKYFIDKFNGYMKKDIHGVDDDVMKCFLNYSWPGNVRELKNTIEGAFNVAQGKYIHREDIADQIAACLTQKDAPESAPAADGPLCGEELPLERQMRCVEKELLERAIKNSKSYSEAAKKLGISRQSFMYKLKKYQIV